MRRHAAGFRGFLPEQHERAAELQVASLARNARRGVRQELFEQQATKTYEKIAKSKCVQVSLSMEFAKHEIPGKVVLRNDDA